MESHQLNEKQEGKQLKSYQYVTEVLKDPIRRLQ